MEDLGPGVVLLMAVPPSPRLPLAVEQKGGQNLGVWTWDFDGEVSNPVDDLEKLTLGTFSFTEWNR